MYFEVGKQYIVSVSENGIIPIEEFSRERYYDIEHDDLDFLTDEEKMVIINAVLDKIRAEIQALRGCSCWCSDGIIDDVEDILDKYKAEREVDE